MALISCPNCTKKISDKAENCQHCGITIKGIDEDKLNSIKRVRVIKRSQRLINHSLMAIILFCAGFVFLYWGEPNPHDWQYLAAHGSILVGFVWYIVCRIMIIILKRKS